jgi:hypothetical protein
VFLNGSDPQGRVRPDHVDYSYATDMTYARIVVTEGNLAECLRQLESSPARVHGAGDLRPSGLAGGSLRLSVVSPPSLPGTAERYKRAVSPMKQRAILRPYRALQPLPGERKGGTPGIPLKVATPCSPI